MEQVLSCQDSQSRKESAKNFAKSIDNILDTHEDIRNQIIFWTLLDGYKKIEI